MFEDYGLGWVIAIFDGVLLMNDFAEGRAGGLFWFENFLAESTD